MLHTSLLMNHAPQIPSINLMLARVIGVSHPLCPWVSSTIQIEVTLWMILLLWRPRLLSAKCLTIGRMTQKRKRVMLAWKTKELPAIWTLFYKHCTTYLISGRCETMHILHILSDSFFFLPSHWYIFFSAVRPCIICQPLKMTCHLEVFPWRCRAFSTNSSIVTAV